MDVCNLPISFLGALSLFPPICYKFAQVIATIKLWHRAMSISRVQFLEVKLLVNRLASVNCKKWVEMVLMLIYHLNIRGGTSLFLSSATSLTSEWKNSKLWSLPVPTRFPWYSWTTWSHWPRRSSRISWFARKRWCSWVSGCSWTSRCQRIKRYLTLCA